MASTWQPPLPPCVCLMRAQSALIIRDTPSITGRKRGSIPAGAIVRVAKGDVCLLHEAKYRYIRLVSWGKTVYQEPLWVVVQEVGAVVKDWLKVYRDECP